MSYGYLHRGRVVEFDATTGGYIVEIPTLAPTRRMGPYPSNTPNLPVGQRVVLASMGTSRDEMVIIGRLPGVAPSIEQIPGLQAALDAKADDSDMTALDARLDVVEPLVATHTGELGTLDGRLDTAETELVSLDGRLDTAEADLITADSRLDAVDTTLLNHVGRLLYLENVATTDRDLFGDVLSTMPRNSVTNSFALTNGTLYVWRLYCKSSSTVSAVRMVTSVAGVGGTTAIGVYTGTATNALTQVRSGTITLGGPGRVTHNLSSNLSIGSVTHVVVCLLPLSYTTQPQVGGRTGVVHSNMLNPSAALNSALTKAGVAALPATIDFTDGSWTTTATSLPWVALG